MPLLLGSAPNQISVNSDLGTAAFIDAKQLPVSDPQAAALAPIANPAFTGNVGIGTSSSTSKLHIRSDTNALSVIGQIQNRNAGANAGGVIAFINSTSDIADNRYAYIGAVTTGADQNSNNLVFATNPNGNASIERMRITSIGDLGIGTTTPGAKLEVVGDIRIQSTSPRVVFYETDNPTKIWQAGLGGGNFLIVDVLAATIPLSIAQGAPNACLTLTATGNVGIGANSTSVSAILDVQSTTKGARMPNMTTTQKNAIASPVAGLMVYDTTLSKMCVFTTVWETITSVA
jgi:hypothetical protein